MIEKRKGACLQGIWLLRNEKLVKGVRETKKFGKRCPILIHRIQGSTLECNLKDFERKIFGKI